MTTATVDEGAGPAPRPRRRPSLPARTLYRAPKFVFRLHLDRFMGDRYFLLTHKGRRSGQVRTTCLEVLRREPGTGELYAAVAYGSDSEWLRNVVAEPRVRVRWSGHEFPALAMVATESWSREELCDYAKRHPSGARRLARFLGYKSVDTVAAFGDLAREMPVVEFVPTDGRQWPV